MKPHKHAKVIKDWADGHQIEIKSKSGDYWVEINCPCWVNSAEYRVKPSIITKHRYAFRLGDYVDMTSDHYTYEEASNKFPSFSVEAIKLSAKEFEI
jgi:hypothetical protein